MNDPVQKSTLSNGLQLETVESAPLHVGMSATYVRAGSRHEDPARNGVSHFLEHLFFRGSEGYPDGRTMNALVEDCGGSLNGVTTRDHGYYFSPVHPERRHPVRSEEHTSELQSLAYLVCRLLLEKKKKTYVILIASKSHPQR